MSHHSDSEFRQPTKNEIDEIEKLRKNMFPILPLPIREDTPEAGATGKFPDGKLTSEDKGEIAIKVGTVGDKVVMDFGKLPINWIGFSPDEAYALGRILFEKADIIKYAKG